MNCGIKSLFVVALSGAGVMEVYPVFALLILTVSRNSSATTPSSRAGRTVSSRARCTSHSIRMVSDGHGKYYA